jgi:type II secretory pathway pseudopilin PulG
MGMKKLNSTGMSLVELMLALAISFIVLAAVAMFIMSGSRNYKFAEAEVSLQSEAQVVMNQLTDMICKSNNVKYVAPVLTIYNIEDSVNDYPRVEIRFDSTNKQLWLKKIDSTGTAGVENLMGEYLKNISFTDTGDTNGNAVVDIDLEMEISNGTTKTYSLSSKVAIRNNIKLIP